MEAIICFPGLLREGRVDFWASYQMTVLAKIIGTSVWDRGHPSCHSSLGKNASQYKEVPLVHYNLEIIRAMFS